jgi:hypothetical protein
MFIHQGLTQERGTAELQPLPPRKTGKKPVCRYYDIKSFMSFTVQVKSPIEIS